MSQYKVASELFTLGAVGSTISDEELEGYNVDALVEGGHLKPVSKKSEDKE